MLCGLHEVRSLEPKDGLSLEELTEESACLMYICNPPPPCLQHGSSGVQTLCISGKHIQWSRLIGSFVFRIRPKVE